jgi:hypothetical protein
MRDGAVWLIAAGAANTAGKGGPLTLSRGTVPLDSGNSTTWAWEVANGGREVYGNAYSYAVRQFSYPDVDQNLALSIAIPRRQPLSPPNHSFCRRPISVAKLREHNPNEVP